MTPTTTFKTSAALLSLCAACLSPLAHAGAGVPGHSHSHSSASIGQAGNAAQVSRTIEVEMGDSMRFTPANFQVQRGETVRFVVRNTGQLQHEFNLGTSAALKEHYALMLKFPEMEHSEPNVASVAPGQSGEVIWKFTQAGTVSIGCLHPGHYDAGMKGSIKVLAAK
jgi:uncharacterized cupredoxin-like copper-binding protein